MIYGRAFFLGDVQLKFRLSDQESVSAGYVSFQKEKIIIICDPVITFWNLELCSFDIQMSVIR